VTNLAPNLTTQVKVDHCFYTGQRERLWKGRGRTLFKVSEVPKDTIFPFRIKNRRKIETRTQKSLARKELERKQCHFFLIVSVARLSLQSRVLSDSAEENNCRGA
jgi:hypothetical protein